MNKKLLIPLMVLGVISLVVAGVYYVNSLTLTVDVYEPITSEYAIIGDAGNWDGTTCLAYAGTWTVMPSDGVIDKVGLYAGEGRAFCVRVSNAGQGTIPYKVTSEIINTNEEIKAKCISAFGEHSVEGSVTGLGTSINGVGVVVDAGADPVSDCKIKIKVGRGTTA